MDSFKSTLNHNGLHPDVICSVCHESLVGGIDDTGNTDLCVRLPSCSHVFHKYCIEEWFRTPAEAARSSGPACPLCRTTCNYRLETEVCLFSQAETAMSDAIVPAQSDFLSPEAKKVVNLLVVLKKMFKFMEEADPDVQTHLGKLQGRLNVPELDKLTAKDEEGRGCKEEIEAAIKEFGDVWACAMTKNLLERYKPELHKWQEVAESIKMTREQKSNYMLIYDKATKRKQRLNEYREQEIERQRREKAYMDAHIERVADKYTQELRDKEVQWGLKNATQHHEWTAKYKTLIANYEAEIAKNAQLEQQSRIMKKQMQINEHSLAKTQLMLQGAQKRKMELKAEIAYLRSRTQVEVDHDNSSNGSEVSDESPVDEDDPFLLSPALGSPRRAVARPEPTRREIKVSNVGGKARAVRVDLYQDQVVPARRDGTVLVKKESTRRRAPTAPFPASQRPPMKRSETLSAASLELAGLNDPVGYGMMRPSESSNTTWSTSAMAGDVFVQPMQPVTEAIDDGQFEQDFDEGAGTARSGQETLRSAILSLATGPRFQMNASTSSKRSSNETLFDRPDQKRRAVGEMRRIKALPSRQ